MSMIEIYNLTKDYGNNKGVFDVSFSIEKGEVFGFLGPNGAGKTTTIRHLLGFLNADSGSCTINGLNCRTSAHTIQKSLGYLPGEMPTVDDMTGTQLVKFIAELRGLNDLKKANELMERFELNPKGRIKKMSKGMKQKIGIVCSFMHDPDILILDEPTSGLDPLMQNRFVELILEEKQKGKTILMSSHMFEEVERTCDRVGIIREGKLVAIDDIDTLKASKRKNYVVSLSTQQEAQAFSQEPLNIISIHNNIVTVSLQGDMSPFLQAMTKYQVTNLDVASQSLEEVFMNYYGNGGQKNV
ncbi:ABC transporter ATP-binding protein [Paludicola sp. MB14-C6]|uniref:ABC transporter ATP-binding protein n=1 Tax=Paludihabitans sp. MB14-C6 TaxID=3070656 RepID=UPI0027DB10E3|nr:ABC transporter ATP-binding protein [Paludicola sp. MB14-C6]WMJ23978.1 ABC transporter ATP-binding protein [Paludicola sp. MB14-C6]